MDRTYPPGTIAFAVTLDDGSKPPVAYGNDGTFSFPRAASDQPYRLVITADGSTSELQHTSSQLKLVSLVAGRPDRRPLAAATLQFSVPIAGVAQSSAYVESTGLWTQSFTGAVGPTVSFDWRLAAAATGSVIGLLDAAHYDRVYVIEKANYVLPGPAGPYTAS